MKRKCECYPSIRLAIVSVADQKMFGLDHNPKSVFVIGTLLNIQMFNKERKALGLHFVRLVILVPKKGTVVFEPYISPVCCS